MMHLPDFQPPTSVADARAQQNALRHRLRITDDFDPPQRIGGVDVGYDLRRNLAHASIVILDAKSLTVLEQVQCFTPVQFPYVPGLLAFREIPAILQALAELRHPSIRWPELWMIDGQGIAHSRRMGIAAHLGVLLDRPTIGVAKSRLYGTYSPPGMRKGDRSPLRANDGEMLGYVLRSRESVQPLFISPGHRIGVESAVDWVMRCLTRFRLPEPTRLADKFSKCPPKPIEDMFEV